MSAARKTCKRCGIEKETENFKYYSDSGLVKRKDSICIECRKDDDRMFTEVLCNGYPKFLDKEVRGGVL